MSSKKKYEKPKLTSDMMYVETSGTCTKRDCSAAQAGPCAVGPDCTPKS